MPASDSFRRRLPAGRVIAAAIVLLVIFLIVAAPPPAFAQDPMTNGEDHSGAISFPGEIDTWSFSATAGDYVVLAIGETGGTDTAFFPWIQLFSPSPGSVSLGSQSGALAATIGVNVTATGTYTVQVRSNDSGNDDTGTYRLTLAKSPGSFVVPVGDTGGDITNGSNYSGGVGPGDIDMWSFTATAGDYIALSLGEIPPSGVDPGFVPWIRLIAPNGALQGSTSGTNVAQFNLASAPLTGIYTVVVATFDSGFNAIGDYQLTLAKAPGAFVISGGDEGGALTNGSNHAGAIHQGDLDVWTFSATTGDYIAVSLGEVPPSGADPGFAPWLRVVAPNGALQENVSGANAIQGEFNAPLTGTYTVIVGSFDSGMDATGDYLLTLAKAPGAVVISNGDQGGPMVNGSTHAGSIHTGDTDVWTFSATTGDYIAVRLGEVPPSGVDTGFAPWLRVVTPTGALVQTISGANATEIDFNATVSGTYSIIVGSFDSGLDATGDYLVTLAKGPGALVISGGDQGGPMTNGSNHSGSIYVGDLDAWTFTATTGDYVVVRLGEVPPSGVDGGFNPWVRVVTPTGVLQGSLSGTNAIEVAFAAPTTGTYTVIVASNDSGWDGTGDYILTLAKAPGAFVTPGGDQGGAIINGVNHPGSIHVGDLDMWTFNAGASEAVAVSVGEVLGVDTGLQPWVRVIAPNGALLGSVSNLTVAHVDMTTTVAGTYTVIVSSGDSGLDGTGNYLLTIAKTGGFTVPVDDEGGPMTTSVNHTGSIHVGDLDQWSFFAHQGNPLTVAVSEDGSDVQFNPWIRLRSPTGVQLGSQSGAATASIVVAAPSTGYYTVVVSTGDSGNDATGQYFVSVNGNDPSTNLIRNGDFSTGETNWQFFATPDLSYISHNVTAGVLNYFRVSPPPGTSNQAVAFQETGVGLATDTPLMAQFDLANTNSVRKRISVLIIDSNFSDISVCTFWLPANAPMRTYQMKSHTTKAWANAALYFYAASPGSHGGFYQIDNVSLQQMPAQSIVRTDCVDPTAPVPPGGADGPELLVNGNFDTGTLAPWFTFGTITSQIVGGVFEFIKPSSVQPAGVVAQPTAQPISANEILTAEVDLGNSSGVRKRVTVIVHDNDFTDLSACTFWLPPGQPLSTYSVRMFATEAWTNASLSVYPATVGFDQWIRLDNAKFRRTPSAVNPGTACLEPGSAGDEASPVAVARAGSVTDAEPIHGAAPADSDGIWQDGGGFVAPSGVGSHWEAIAVPGDSRTLQSIEPIDLRLAATAQLTFRSWLSTFAASPAVAEVQVRAEGGDWVRLQVVAPSDAWMPLAVDLTPFVGGWIELRFVLNPSLAPETPDVWRIGEIDVEIGI